jgi:hypothetical protein
MKTGLKVCVHTANNIRRAVNRQKELNSGRVPQGIVEGDLRLEARVDSLFHQLANPDFSYGGGPAVERHQ